MDMENVAMKIGKGASYLLAGSFIGYIISFFYRIILARWLLPYDYGIFSLVLMLIGFGTVFFSLGIFSAVIKYIPEYLVKKKDHNIIFSSAFSITVILATISTLTIFFLAEPLAVNVFNAPDAILPFQLSSFVLFFTILAALFNSGIVGFQRMEFSALGGVVEKLTKLIASIVLLYLGFELLGVVGAIIIGSFLMAITFILSYRRLTPISLKPMNTKTVKLLMKFGMPFFIAGMGGILLSWTDTFFIGFFLSVEWVGYYNVALPVLWILGMFIISLAGALFPAFSEIHARGDKNILEKTFNRSMKYAIYLLIPATVGAFMLAEPIIRILFTTAYLPAVPAFQILVFGSMFLSLKGITGSYINGIGKPKIVMKFALIAAFINIILNWFLVQTYGITGAAYATSLSLALLFFLSLNFVRRSIRLNFKYLPKPLIATLIMSLFIWFVRSLVIMGILKMALILVFSVGVYFCGLYILRGFDEADKKLIRKVYNKTRNR